ncbi:MAG: hypothetical protein ACYDC1_18810, partial [Limisphaerales bacterium]
MTKLRRRPFTDAAEILDDHRRRQQLLTEHGLWQKWRSPANTRAWPPPDSAGRFLPDLTGRPESEITQHLKAQTPPGGAGN